MAQVSIHTPTKGVTRAGGNLQQSDGSFNPHTHEGCDAPADADIPTIVSFNPHTHEGCDSQPIPSPSCSSSFNPHTHEGCDPSPGCKPPSRDSFNPHTHEGCDVERVETYNRVMAVSIHTPTKGVTRQTPYKHLLDLFQSTHPRRV